ncbi:MAG: sodium-independent anion transporter, partial [Campylobacteraceae bacterium]|nr:sodium-independent anion transporter [Campylobacteraceae bacterium]
SHLMYCDIFTNEDKSVKTYQFVGQLFFNSADKFYETIDFKEVLDKVIIDVSKAHFWDVSAVYALDKAIIKLRRSGTTVEIVGQNEASKTLIDKFGIHDKPEEIKKVMGGS